MKPEEVFGVDSDFDRRFEVHFFSLFDNDIPDTYKKRQSHRIFFFSASLIFLFNIRQRYVCFMGYLKSSNDIKFMRQQVSVREAIIIGCLLCYFSSCISLIAELMFSV